MTRKSNTRKRSHSSSWIPVKMQKVTDLGGVGGLIPVKESINLDSEMISERMKDTSMGEVKDMSIDGVENEANPQSNSNVVVDTNPDLERNGEINSGFERNVNVGVEGNVNMVDTNPDLEGNLERNGEMKVGFEGNVNLVDTNPDLEGILERNGEMKVGFEGNVNLVDTNPDLEGILERNGDMNLGFEGNVDMGLKRGVKRFLEGSEKKGKENANVVSENSNVVPENANVVHEHANSCSISENQVAFSSSDALPRTQCEPLKGLDSLFVAKKAMEIQRMGHGLTKAIEPLLALQEALNQELIMLHKVLGSREFVVINSVEDYQFLQNFLKPMVPIKLCPSMNTGDKLSILKSSLGDGTDVDFF